MKACLTVLSMLLSWMVLAPIPGIADPTDVIQLERAIEKWKAGDMAAALHETAAARSWMVEQRTSALIDVFPAPEGWQREITVVESPTDVTATCDLRSGEHHIELVVVAPGGRGPLYGLSGIIDAYTQQVDTGDDVITVQGRRGVFEEVESDRWTWTLVVPLEHEVLVNVAAKGPRNELMPIIETIGWDRIGPLLVTNR